jgi:hypothetical protein
VTRLLSAFLLIGTAAAAVIIANLALLGYASKSHDPVGKLNPRAPLPAAPSSVVRPQRGQLEDKESDD